MLEFKHLYERKLLEIKRFMNDAPSRSLVGARDFLFREILNMSARLGHSQ